MAAGGEALLLDYPELRPLVLPNARITGRRIGVASHGRMEEVEIPGATCAARKTPNIFQDRPETPEVEISRAMRQFVEECQLMGSLRHPHILQFLGVCFMPGLRFPAMVAERLMISLHELLDPEMVTKSAPRLYIPLALKRSMLHDMARGVAFLHSHAPPIIHRDLSARNVLLDSAMVAKIADLGMARFSPNLRPAMRRNRASEAPVYMPPEALVDELRNDKTIDIFSFGILTIFVLSQTFPRPLSATYMDAKKMIVSRTELERRANYMQQIHSLIHRGHTLITMIELCLDDSSDKRPTIGHILQRLEGAKAEVQDNESDLNKLLLVQNLRQKTQQIRSNEDRIQSLQSSLEAKDKELNTRMEMITSLRSKIVRQEDMIADLQIQLERLVPQRVPQEEPPFVPQPLPEESHRALIRPPELPPGRREPEVPEITEHIPKFPVNLWWRRGVYTPFGVFQAQAISIDQLIYLGGGEAEGWTNEYTVLRYSHRAGRWDKLPESPVCNFALASLNGQLVLVGGNGDDPRIAMLNEDATEWLFPFPSMPTGRPWLAAVGYRKHLLVACGFCGRNTVEVLDSSSGTWYSAQPVPVGGHRMSSALIGDTWFLSSSLWEDDMPHVFSVHLPTLIAAAKSPKAGKSPMVWKDLPYPPVDGGTLLCAYNNLLLVGGGGGKVVYYYDMQSQHWEKSGELGTEVASHGLSCAFLPNGELIAIGGKKDVDDFEFTNEVHIGGMN